MKVIGFIFCFTVTAMMVFWLVYALLVVFGVVPIPPGRFEESGEMYPKEFQMQIYSKFKTPENGYNT